MKLIVLGKTKEQYLKTGINEFLKRLNRFTKLEYLEVNSLDNLKLDNSYIITLEINGIEYSSEGLAHFLKINTEKNLVFIIGDENGIPKEIKSKANTSISLSKMTFTHEFARLIFLEQLYRAFTINSRMKYHK